MDIPTKTFKSKIEGKQTNIEVKTDIPWGSFQKIINSATQSGAFNFNNFIDLLMEEVIVGGVDPKDRTGWKQIPSLEMTELIGKVGEILPLMHWFENLKMDKLGLDKVLSQST